MDDLIHIPFKGGYTFGETPPTVVLVRQSAFVRADDGEVSIKRVWTTYPVTIVQSRYNGSYEGGSWLAFPISPNALEAPFWTGWNDSDADCMTWWRNADANKYPIGRGKDATSAYDDLIERLLALGEVEAEN